jgi:catalase
MTTQQGIPVGDDQNSLRAGPRGPTLLEDFILREKIFHFDHERIPERVVHARGFGAHGVFELTESLAEFTTTEVLTNVGQQTEVFVRFSTVAGRAGSMDLARDVRGFAVKLYTTRELGYRRQQYPGLFHSGRDQVSRSGPCRKGRARSRLSQAQSAHDNFWDFASLMPEAWHMIMWQMSDRTIPRSFRTMEGFGVHSFRLVNASGRSTFVKFHWKPRQGLQSVLWNEAVKINGADPDFHRRDLWDAIESGDYPQWDLGVQLFTEEQAETFEFDHLDATKLIPEEVVPVRIIGTMTLNRTVDNFFAETEQVAFCTQNIVPGIDFSDDPLLHGRNFSYLDTQLKRLGSPNFTHLPINAPRCPVMHFQQDGHMAMVNPKGRANYEPNSWGKQAGPREDPARGFRSFAAQADGSKQRIRSETFSDHYSQARQFYISQTPIEQKHLRDALVFELSKCERVDIRARAVSHLVNIDAQMAAMVADGLGMELPEAAVAAKPTLDLAASAALSIIANGPNTFKGRKLGIRNRWLGRGTLQGADRRNRQGGRSVEVVAPKIGGVTLDDGTTVAARHKIDGGPSVLFDAVALLPSNDGATMLSTDAASKDFVSDAYAHCKFIGHSAAASSLFAAARLPTERDEGFISLDGKGSVDSFVEILGQLRFWPRELAVDIDAKPPNHPAKPSNRPMPQAWETIVVGQGQQD